MSDVGSALIDAGKYAEGTALLEEAIAIDIELGGDNAVAALRFLGLAHDDELGPAAALATFDRGVALCKGRQEADTYCALLRANRAGVLADLGRAEAGLREAVAAVAAFVSMDRADANEMAQCLESRAMALNALGRTVEADAEMDRAIALYVQTYGDEHVEVARAKRNLAKLHEKRTAK
jgi:tetratricopeptide (TPR) repeat protein